MLLFQNEVVMERKNNRSINIRIIAAIVCIALTSASFGGCGGRKVVIEGPIQMFKDSCGRDVEIPEKIDRVAPSGAVSQMVLATIAPEKLVGLSATPSSSQIKYLPEYFIDLPTFGQFYGSKSTLNMESLIAAKPDITIDIGDMKENHASDMNDIQKQTGVPTIFVETSIDKMADAYRTLGKLLNKEAQGNHLADFIDKTVSMAESNAAKIPKKQRKSVMYGTGSTGLACNASGSIQADVIDIIGAENAIKVSEKELNNAGGGNTVSMEQVYNFQPDVIIFTAGGAYSTIANSKEWSQLSAVKNNDYYEIPGEPYNWMSGPPSVNRILGIWWLGNLVYPDIYDYDMREISKEFYSLFYNYELTDEEVDAMLANSTLKN